MRYYDINLRPGGHQQTDVPLKKVSAAEVFLLRNIHGQDAVIKVQPRDSDKIEHHVLRDQLVEKYGPEKVIPVFGSAFDVRLPEKLDTADAEAHAPLHQQAHEDTVQGLM